MPEEDSSKGITRSLNDEFHRSMNPDLGRCIMTRAVAKLPELERIAAVQKARFFDAFNDDVAGLFGGGVLEITAGAQTESNERLDPDL
jgi:hypothetical protein